MVFAFGGYLDRTMSWCYGSPSCWEGESQYSPEYHRSRADYPPDGVESIQPPNIGCHQSRLPTLGSQPSELVFPGAIQLRSESKPVVWTCCMNLETFRSFLVWRASLYAYAVTLRWPKRGKYLFLKKVRPYLSSLCPVFIVALERSYRELETLAVKTTISI